ncbi:CBD9-like protein [Basidiobolus meristosporus CBS 931.73]|uniref:CBD9-like protein n=1 Tax=Basidiobolus meristosporus CBS 931.73 TaxID=1314790 RepID=A0A1Y1Y076_9FUNG|nr:CBD9-like protein [Basidiobolus meristosporus CBS 931.73]|eukprot:ORX91410.1 CBD9-like protein [Basidiobolus meristosporus CBS 931.73]
MKLTATLGFGLFWTCFPSTWACECDIPLPKSHVSYRSTQPIVLDGVLDDEAWDKVPWTDYFGNIQGSDGPSPPPSISTRVKTMWDDEYLYVGAVMHDPMIRASTEKPVVGKPYQDNDFRLYLDYDRSNQNYKVLQMNALGLYKSVILDKSPSQNGTERLWDLGDDFKYKIFVNGEINDPNWKPVEGGYWSLEWQIPLAKLSPKTLQKRGTMGIPSYMNFQFLRTGFPPRGIVTLAPQPTGNTSPSYFLFGVNPSNASNGQSLQKRHEVGARFQFSWTPQYSNDPNNPELWGSIMFRDTTNTYKPYVKDPSVYTRFALMQLYYSQMEYAKKHHGKFANSYDKLDLNSTVIGECTPSPVIKVSNGCTEFEASIRFRKQIGHINQDKLLYFTYN